MMRHTQPGSQVRAVGWGRVWLVAWLALSGVLFAAAFRGSFRADQPALATASAAWQSQLRATSASAATERTRSIEDILPGDIVLAWDDQSGELAPRRVVRVFCNTTHHLRLVTLRSADGLTEQTLQTTDEHPFYVAGRGWVPAAELSPGDPLVQSDGRWAEVVVTEFEALPEGLPVYNFEVEDAHTYFVSADLDLAAILAHNTCTSTSSTHGNSHASTLRQHRYELIDRLTGVPYKTGISGRAITRDGRSYRAQQQLSGYKKRGWDLYSVIVETAENRAQIVAAEKAAVTWSRRFDLYSLPGNKRPLPDL